MAKKKLTEEQENEIKTLLANNEMLERTKGEIKIKNKPGNKHALKQVEIAQEEVYEKIKMIDPTLVPKNTSLSSAPKKVIKQDNLFQDKEMSIYDMIMENEMATQDMTRVEEEKKMASTTVQPDIMEIVPNENIVVNDTVFNTTTDLAYDVIQLPSNGQTYRNKVDHIGVAYLTAYDENIITSPNLYRDGLVIDYLLKSKVVGGDINVEDLVSGDADAIILYLRATSYGAEFPIQVSNQDENGQPTGEIIDTTIDLTKLKPRQFTLIGDENGHFDFETPVKKDKIKFRYLTRKQERQLRQVTELEGYGTKAALLDREIETLNAALVSDKYISDSERVSIKAGVNAMMKWSEKLKKVNQSEFTRMMTNSMQLQVVAVNGNYDREYVRKYINRMPARDSMALRRYINDNRPGIDFDIEVERPLSLGGGSFKTFLNWDDTVFLNLPDV